MYEVECPYCNEEFDLCHDDGAFYREGTEETECPACDKKFLVNCSVSWSYDAEKCECLNTGEHEWIKEYSEHLIKSHPELACRERCKHCDEKRKI